MRSVATLKPYDPLAPAPPTATIGNSFDPSFCEEVMKAICIFDRRISFGERDFAELVAWYVPTAVPPSSHLIKYRLAYVVDGVRVVGFDNERGKGDHRHDDGVESPYLFRDVEGLVADFNAAVLAWRRAHGRD